MVFIGVDPSGRPRPACFCAALTAEGRVLRTWEAAANEAFVASLAEFGEVKSVAVDGPLRLPQGHSPAQFFSLPSTAKPRRSSELELARMGIGCFFTVPRSFAKGWILRCLQLGELLRLASYSVLEVYPYATRRVLWGRRMGHKHQKATRLQELDLLRRMGLSWQPRSLPSDHEMDAVLCALTGFLSWKGYAMALGNEADGQIIIPDPRVDWPTVLPALWKGR